MKILSLAINVSGLLLASCGQNTSHDRGENGHENVAAGDQWQYDVYLDEMRGLRTWYATLESENTLDLDFPYQGGSKASITLAQNQKDDPFNQQPILTLENAQLDCGSTCEISVKFDDGPILRSVGTPDQCGSSQCVNLNIREDIEGSKFGPGFSRRLFRGKTVIVEVPIHRFGDFQFQFNVRGLVWPQPNAPKTGAGTGLLKEGTSTDDF